MKMGKQWFLNKFLSSGRCMANSTVLCLTEKLKKDLKSSYDFGGRCYKITDVCMDL